MLLAAAAFAFSFNVRSKAPKGSATDDGTAMSPGSFERSLQQQTQEFSQRAYADTICPNQVRISLCDAGE